MPSEPTAAAAAPTSAVLTPAQQTHLLALIIAITDSMRAQLSDALTSTSVESAASAALRFVIQVEGEKPSPATAATGTDVASGHDLPDEDGLRELKLDALKWFDRWRSEIVKVLGGADDAEDVMSSEKEGHVTGSGKEKGNDGDFEVLDPNPFIPSLPSLTTLYPPISTPLSSLPLSTRSALLSTMLPLALAQGSYAAPVRVLLLHLTSSLDLPLSTLQEAELKTAHTLLDIAAQNRMSATAETQKRSAANATSRRWKVGLAGVAGAALIGVTGGLAAPLVAGAIGTVMGSLGLGATAAAGLLGTLGSSGVIVGGLFGAYGYGMTSKMMDRYAKEVEDFAFLSMRKAKRGANSRSGNDDIGKEERSAEEDKDRRLRVAVGVSGWLAEKRDVVTPWKVIGTQSEVFALRWELDVLSDMGISLETMVSSAVWAIATREIVARTVFASLMFAMWPIALLKLSKVVDNPFNVAKNRADKAGLVLADAIINKAQGERPISLIGYSVGARLIYSCLMSLAERRAFGLVESAVLIGTPAPSDANMWRAIRSVVSGRLVNVHSEKDYVLAFLYRTSSIQLGVAGLEAIKGVNGVENVDVSSIVTSHLRYPHLVGKILQGVGWEDIDIQEVEREEHIAEMLDEKDKQRTVEADSASNEGVPPALPNRPEFTTTNDPLGSNSDLMRPRDALFDEALTAKLASYVKQEDPQRFRCLVPECQKLFRGEHFWKRHVGMRHTEWLEGIKQEVKSAASETDVPKTKEKEAIPALQEKVGPNSEGDDLMSFHEEPKENEAVNELQYLTSRLEEQNITEVPKQQREPMGKGEVRRHEHMADMSDDENSNGITMIDNDEDDITMPEAVPLPKEEAQLSAM